LAEAATVFAFGLTFEATFLAALLMVRTTLVTLLARLAIRFTSAALLSPSTTFNWLSGASCHSWAPTIEPFEAMYLGSGLAPRNRGD
jgi:hypothetical protein